MPGDRVPPAQHSTIERDSPRAGPGARPRAGTVSDPSHHEGFQSSRLTWALTAEQPGAATALRLPGHCPASPLSVTPGNRRRNSIAAANSPPRRTRCGSLQPLPQRRQTSLEHGNVSCPSQVAHRLSSCQGFRYVQRRCLGGRDAVSRASYDQLRKSILHLSLNFPSRDPSSKDTSRIRSRQSAMIDPGGHIDRRIGDFSFSRRECLDRSPSGTASDSLGIAGQVRGGQRDGTGKLCDA
jgi:hypothetical protein